ncbi:hypothetical protein SAMN05216167_10421 [Spirosoma endophyticum]|uniref:Transposase n=1 Tax=Spirosoma endophyticum TaxID=662367 RepID=A0A1I1QMG0_9BACT|nr:hypothetical protein SAMN05216167_10421 [Spirosoma endophyticum]
MRQHGVTTTAMESTGSYWQTLFNALQEAGFEVLLIGGSQTKNVQMGQPVQPKNGCYRLFVLELADRGMVSKKKRGQYWISPSIFRPATIQID